MPESDTTQFSISIAGTSLTEMEQRILQDRTSLSISTESATRTNKPQQAQQVSALSHFASSPLADDTDSRGNALRKSSFFAGESRMGERQVPR